MKVEIEIGVDERAASMMTELVKADDPVTAVDEALEMFSWYRDAPEETKDAIQALFWSEQNVMKEHYLLSHLVMKSMADGQPVVIDRTDTPKSFSFVLEVETEGDVAKIRMVR